MQPKKQLKVQYIGIFEEIDSFYWPKMQFLKKGQNIRAWVGPPPSFGQCPKENVFFPLMSSPTYSFEIILASEYVVHVQYISQVVWGWMKNGDKNRTFLDICFCSHYPWVHSAIDRMEIGHFFIFHFYHAPQSPKLEVTFFSFPQRRPVQ